MSFIGVKLGSKFGDKYEKKAQILGGVILIAMGLKILLSHLGIF
jgi:putative Mn2+ efflux pump MntP